MSRRRGIALLIAGILLITIGVFVWGREREPEYQGKPLRYWIHGTSSGMWEEAGITESPEEVLRKMGPEVVPWLVKWLKARDGQPSKLFSGTRDKLPYWLREHLPDTESADELNWLGLRGLHLLGPAAHEALPALEEALHDADGERQARAAWILADMGEVGVLSLASGLRNRNADIRRSVSQACWRRAVAGKLSAQLLGHMRMALGDTNAWVRLHAAKTILRCVPHDDEAKQALFALVRHESGLVRENALRALYPIAKQATELIPLLLEMTKFQPAVESRLHECAISVLGEMGPAAKEAVPCLTGWLTNGYTTCVAAAAEGLGKIGSDARTSVSLLRMVSNDQNHSTVTRAAAGKALWKLDRDTNAVLANIPELMLYQTSFRSSNSAPETETLDIISEIGPPAQEALQFFPELLQAENMAVRHAAERALRKIDPDGTWQNGSPRPPSPPDPAP